MPESLAAAEQPTFLLPSPVEELEDDRLQARGVRLYLKRDDLIHPEFPGNKWRKLERNVEAAQAADATVLLTFGGAYSNHIGATAAAGRYFGLSTIGVIRGEEHLPLNPSLAYAVSRGMVLTYLDRPTYRRKNDPDVLDALRERFGSFYLVPEGGSNELGVQGCTQISEEIGIDFDVICCACGTGATLAGIASGLDAGRRAIGFAALKGGDFLTRDVEALQIRTFGATTDNWTVNTEFHFGGFARRTAELDAFIEDIHRRHGIALEWVYVAKMLYGVFALVDRGVLPSGTTVVAVMTG